MFGLKTDARGQRYLVLFNFAFGLTAHQLSCFTLGATLTAFFYEEEPDAPADGGLLFEISLFRWVLMLTVENWPSVERWSERYLNGLNE